MIAAFFGSIILLVLNLLFVYKWIVIISTLLTWVQPDPNNQVVIILGKLTNPVYNWIKKRIKTVFNEIDLTPIIVIFAIMFLETFLIGVIN